MKQGSEDKNLLLCAEELLPDYTSEAVIGMTALLAEVQFFVLKIQVVPFISFSQSGTHMLTLTVLYSVHTYSFIVFPFEITSYKKFLHRQRITFFFNVLIERYSFL